MSENEQPAPNQPSIDLAVRFDLQQQSASPSCRFEGFGNSTQWAACVAACIVSIDDAVHQLAEALKCSPQELAAQAQAMATPTMQRMARERSKKLVVPSNGLRIAH